MAIWTNAIMRWARYGLVPPRLDIGATAAIAFSSQSVITLAKAHGVAPTMAAATMSILRIWLGIMCTLQLAIRTRRMLHEIVGELARRKWAGRTACQASVVPAGHANLL